MKPKLSRIHQKKRHRAQEDTHHFSYGNKLSSGHRYGYRRDKKDSIHESNRQRKTTPCGKTKIPRVCQELTPKTHVRAFRLAISRAHLNDDEKEASYCRFFAENLTGAALEWFAGLEENSIDNFTQIVSTFLKQYSVFIETRVTEADLWNLKQAPFEQQRVYINKKSRPILHIRTKFWPWQH